MDWRDADQYAWLTDLDLSALAWEFLRRNPDYRAAAAAAEAAPRWGLVVPADPDRAATETPVFWRAEVAPAHVLRLAPSGGEGADGARLVALSRFRLSSGYELHLRLDGGVQLVIPHGCEGALAALLPLDGDLGARIAAARALERLLDGRPAARDPLSAQGRRRAVQMIRVLDGRSAGASYRELAQGVLGAPHAGREAWRGSSVRDVVIRLSRAAGRMVADGYRALLRRARPA